MCHGNEDDKVLQHFHNLERIGCYFSPLQLQIRNRYRYEETWPWPCNKRKVQPKIGPDLLCLRCLLILGNPMRTTETPRGNTCSFLDVPIFCPINSRHLLTRKFIGETLPTWSAWVPAASGQVEPETWWWICQNRQSLLCNYVRQACIVHATSLQSCFSTQWWLFITATGKDGILEGNCGISELGYTPFSIRTSS